jgi:hypothetical protein
MEELPWRPGSIAVSAVLGIVDMQYGFDGYGSAEGGRARMRAQHRQKNRQLQNLAGIAQAFGEIASGAHEGRRNI